MAKVPYSTKHQEKLVKSGVPFTRETLRAYMMADTLEYHYANDIPIRPGTPLHAHCVAMHGQDFKFDPQPA